MAREGKVLVIEALIPPGNEPSPVKFLDLEMLVVMGGRQRTEEEYRRLYGAAGLQLLRVIPTTSQFSIVEGGASCNRHKLKRGNFRFPGGPPVPKHLFVGLWSLTVLALLTACSGQAVSPSARPGNPGALTPTPLARHPPLPLIGWYTTTLTPSDVVAFSTGASFTLTTKGYNVVVGAGSWKLQISPDGSLWAFGGQSAPGALYVLLGQSAATPQQLRVTLDSKCEEFYGLDAKSALYTWRLQRQTLTLTVVGQDRCPARELLLTRHPWIKQS